MPTRLSCITDVHVSVSFAACSSNDGHCLSSYLPLIYEAVFLGLYRVLTLYVSEKGCSLWKKVHKLFFQQIVCCKINNYFGNHENLLFKIQWNYASSQWLYGSHVAKPRTESWRNRIRPVFQILLKSAVCIWPTFVSISVRIRISAM